MGIFLSGFIYALSVAAMDLTAIVALFLVNPKLAAIYVSLFAIKIVSFTLLKNQVSTKVAEAYRGPSN